MEEIKRMREIGEEYDKLLDKVLNTLHEIIPTCLALSMEDSLFPIYAVNNVRTKGLLAFPYKCEDKIGFVIITEEGKVVFEDYEGNIKELGVIK